MAAVNPHEESVEAVSEPWTERLILVGFTADSGRYSGDGIGCTSRTGRVRGVSLEFRW